MSQIGSLAHFPTMKASPTIGLLLSAVLLATASAQIEFVGFMTSAEGPRFTLKEAKEPRPSEWLKLGDSYSGFKLVAHDPKQGLLSVEKNAERLELPLKQSRVAHGEGQTPAKPKLGKVVVQFKGTTTVTEKTVRDYLQLRPGDEFDEGAIDRSVRALYRSGHFESIEIKNESPTAGTFNLMVILTPK